MTGAGEAGALSRDEFHDLAHFVRAHAGIALAKRDLAGRKLRPVAARFGFKDVSALMRELGKPGTALGRDVIGALTTNETSFFRDRAVFEYVREKMFPALVRRRHAARRLRIWCAGCATGQEAYSIAMAAEEFHHELKDWTVQIVATDIAEGALARARDGRYTSAEVARGLSPDLLHKHFDKTHDGWRAAERMRKAVMFVACNLIEPFADLGPFDAVFCRNVLIYFDAATKHDVLARLRRQLAGDGTLVLGAAETLSGQGKAFAHVPGVHGVYVGKAA